VNVGQMVKVMALVLGLNGSPRKDGNSAMILEEVLRSARECGCETIRLDVADLDICGCRSCWACEETGICVVEDDMALVYDLLLRADALVIASPVYFSGTTSQLKQVIDRCNCLWNRKVPPTKRGAILCVAADPEQDFRPILSELRSFMNSVGFTCKEELLVPGIYRKGEMVADRNAMRLAMEIGARISSC
jgi:multimeric flavodoxin WrbA